MVLIIKATKIERPGENTWVNMAEYPGEKIVIEGIRMEPGTEDLRTQRIMLSKEAVAMIVPSLIKWLELKGIHV